MARPREFDEVEALDRAMLVFWRKGYAEASLADLSAATGLGRQSLYNTFGDKQALFSSALERYATHVEALSVGLSAPGAGLPELREYILKSVNHQAAHGVGACMTVKAALGSKADDGAIQRCVRKNADAVRARLAALVKRVRDRGELPAATDPQQLASYFFVVSSGLSALARTGASATEVEQALAIAFRGLGSESPACGE